MAAFNVGVEIGQIVVATVVWGLMLWMGSHALRWQPRIKAVVAVSCMAVAAIWMFERAKPIVTMVL